MNKNKIQNHIPKLPPNSSSKSLAIKPPGELKSSRCCGIRAERRHLPLLAGRLSTKNAWKMDPELQLELQLELGHHQLWWKFERWRRATEDNTAMAEITSASWAQLSSSLMSKLQAAWEHSARPSTLAVSHKSIHPRKKIVDYTFRKKIMVKGVFQLSLAYALHGPVYK